MLLRHDAVAYYQTAVQVITDNANLAPKYFLFSHCMELALKSYLVLHGWTEIQCRTRLGHSLVRARDEAILAGLAISEYHSAVIDSMSREHWQLSFRYFNPNGWTAPSMDNVQNCCFTVLSEVQAPIFIANNIVLDAEHKKLLR